MAFERLADRKVIASNLNAFIGSSLVLLQNQRVRQNAEKESKFYKAVMEDNLSIDDQIEYRMGQLDSVAKNDTDERIRIRKEVSNLKDRKEVQDFNDAYLSELMQFNSGSQSLDATISWLQDRLSRTTDINIKNNIKDQLTQLKSQQYTQRKAVLERQTQYATEDKSENVLSEQINRVSQERKTALLNGNDDYVSVLDLQLQTLKKSLTESKISKIATNMSVSTLTGQSALSLLNDFNKMVESGDAGTPITIGGVRYDNEQDFWNAKRGEYLNDRAANGFFSRYTAELKEKVDYKQSKNILKNTDMGDVNNWYETVKDRPELTGYEEKINQEQQKSLKYAAELKATETINQFATDLDAAKAVNTISYLQDNFGVNLTSSYQKVIQMASNEKESQIQQILGTMNQIMQNSPGITQEQALKQAVASGAGVVFSPEELATKKASDVITEAGDKAKEQQFGEDGTPDITVPQDKAKGFQLGADFSEGGLYKLPNSASVYQYENGKLRVFEGGWTGDTFNQATGKSFSDVQTVSDISGIEQGTSIKTTDFKLNTEANKRINQQQQNPTQNTPAQAPANPNIIEYKIQRGDTLSAIASKNKTTVDEILKANQDIKDPNNIYAGSTLKLPNQ